jgi:hypothetical protein
VAFNPADFPGCVGERPEDVFALIVQSGSADLDKPDVISASIKDQLLQPSGIQRFLFGRDGRYGLEANPLHGRVIFELHGCSLDMQLCGKKNQVAAAPSLTRFIVWRAFSHPVVGIFIGVVGTLILKPPLQQFHTTHGRVIFELHRCSLLYMQLSGKKNITLRRPLC